MDFIVDFGIDIHIPLKKFDSDLEMVTWKPISIEAITLFITSLNQLCTRSLYIDGVA